MLHPRFPLETERLTYRSYRSGDRDWLVGIRGRDDLMQHVPFGGQSPEEMEAVLAKRMEMTAIDAPGDALMCLMEERVTGALVGEVMLRYPADMPETGEIGFILHSDFHGKGYAFEGAMLMMRLGFETAGFHRMIAITDGKNTSCRRLLKRLGMREEAYFREASYFKGAWHDNVVAAMLAEEWQARSR